MTRRAVHLLTRTRDKKKNENTICLLNSLFWFDFQFFFIPWNEKKFLMKKKFIYSQNKTQFCVFSMSLTYTLLVLIVTNIFEFFIFYIYKEKSDWRRIKVFRGREGLGGTGLRWLTTTQELLLVFLLSQYTSLKFNFDFFCHNTEFFLLQHINRELFYYTIWASFVFFTFLLHHRTIFN